MCVCVHPHSTFPPLLANCLLLLIAHSSSKECREAAARKSALGIEEEEEEYEDIMNERQNFLFADRDVFVYALDWLRVLFTGTCILYSLNTNAGGGLALVFQAFKWHVPRTIIIIIIKGGALFLLPDCHPPLAEFRLLHRRHQPVSHWVQ